MKNRAVEALMSLKFWDIRWKLEKACAANPRALPATIRGFSRQMLGKHTARSLYVLGVLCLIKGDERWIDKVLDTFEKRFSESVEYSLMVAHVWEQRKDWLMTYEALREAVLRSVLDEEIAATGDEFRWFFLSHGRAMAAEEGYKTDYPDDETREGVIVDIGAYRRAKRGAI